MLSGGWQLLLGCGGGGGSISIVIIIALVLVLATGIILIWWGHRCCHCIGVMGPCWCWCWWGHGAGVIVTKLALLGSLLSLSCWVMGLHWLSSSWWCWWDRHRCHRSSAGVGICHHCSVGAGGACCHCCCRVEGSVEDPGDVRLTKPTQSLLKNPWCGRIRGQKCGKNHDSWHITNKGSPRQFDAANTILAKRYANWYGRICGRTCSKNCDNWNIRNKGSPRHWPSEQCVRMTFKEGQWYLYFVLMVLTVLVMLG